MRIAGHALILLLFATLFADAQPFEVAAIKPGDPNTTSYSVGCGMPRGRCSVKNLTLRAIVGFAYGFERELWDRVSGGPGWVSSVRFSIEAKAENPDASKTELLKMLQRLLSEQFKLVLREESVEVNGFRIVAGKDGTKLQPTVSTLHGGVRAYSGGVGPSPVEVEGVNASITDLAEFLSRGLRTTVLDETGLTGSYDFRVLLPTEVATKRTNSVVPFTESDLPLFATQLFKTTGLKIESTKIPARKIVIESAVKPPRQ